MYILISPLYFFFGGGFLKSHFYLFFLAGSFQSHLFFDRLFSKPPFDRLFSEPSFSFCPPQVAHTGLPHHLKKIILCIQYRARHYFVEGRCSTLKGSSIYIHLSKFHHFFYLTCSYRHSKLKKGIDVPQERHGSTRTYQETTETL